MNQEFDYKDVIEATYRIVGAVERRFDALRATDREAVTLAHSDLSHRLAGFPQHYATKVEAEAAAMAVQRLEKESLPREVYEQNHKVLVDAVNDLDRDKLNESVFDTFVENHRIEQSQAADERRNVAEVLANATEQVRAQIAQERADYVTVEYYDRRHTGLVQQINDVQAWQYKLVGGLIFATFVAPLITGILVYLFTSGTL